jgi:Fe-S-cluster containining protein
MGAFIGPIASPCQSCGACCSHSSEWPRFTLEDDAALDLIPEKFVNDALSGMRCDGERCSALNGKIGVATSCGIYAVRPEVCRTCQPGDTECNIARRGYGLPEFERIVSDSQTPEIVV